MTRTLSLLSLLVSTTSAFAGGAQEAYFVRCDRSTTSAAPAGLWVGGPAAMDTSAGPTLSLAFDAAGGLQATVRGDLGQTGEILGWSWDGTSALIGVEPDEIDYDGGDGGDPSGLIGIEPDEIDFMGTCEASTGVEPDEISYATAVTELGEVFEMRSDLGAYVVAEVQWQRDGSVILVPTHVITNAYCF